MEKHASLCSKSSSKTLERRFLEIIMEKLIFSIAIVAVATRG